MAPWNFAILVDAIADATPERIAVVHGDRRVSWQLLASRSRSLAWHLATDAGLRAGDRVAVVLPNCPEYLEVFLAARKLRAAPLGVGVTAGVDELHAVLDRSDARVVVCADTTADAVRAAVRRIPKRWRPKIVEIGEPYEATIAAATPPVDWELEIPTADDLIAIAELDASANRESPDTAVLAVGPFAVGDSFGELLGVLGRKGRAVFLDPPTFDADRVWDTVEREHVVKLVIDGDVQARPLLAALSPGDAAGLTALTSITSASAPMSSDVAAALATVLPRVTLLGVSEAPAADADDATIQRVDPADIEHRLRKHPSIVDCVVVGIADPRIGKLVVAVVEVVEHHYLDAAELAAWCRTYLPATMTPARFVFVDDIARLPSGAVDDAALRTLAIDRLLDGS